MHTPKTFVQLCLYAYAHNQKLHYIKLSNSNVRNNYPNWFYLTTNSSQTMEKIAVSNQNKVSLFYSTCHDELDLI